MKNKTEIKKQATLLLETVHKYGIAYDNGRLVTIEARMWDEQESKPKPTNWAVCKDSTVMSKTGNFDYEPLPSNRTDAFLRKHRFNSAQEAAECWVKYHG